MLLPSYLKGMVTRYRLNADLTIVECLKLGVSGMEESDQDELRDWHIVVLWIFLGWVVNQVLKFNGIELNVRLAWAYIPVLFVCVGHLMWRHKK